MLFDLVRLAGVLARSRDLRGEDDRRCFVEKDRPTDHGWRFDRFVPKKSSKKLSGTALLLLHGWTLHGKDDCRLQAFARALAGAGIECVVPNIPGLAELAFEQADVVGLRWFLEHEARPLGVMGFSFGGGYAMLAASGCAQQPRFILTVSAHGDLPATYQRSLDGGKQAPADPMARESWIYQKLAMAWRQRTTVGLPAAVQEQLRELLMTFCGGSQAEASCDFWTRSLSHVDWVAAENRQQDLAALRALSPSVNPPRLRCPVVILHDKNDGGVWPCEANVLADAVRRGSPEIRVDLMVTDLLQHVRPDLLWRPGEILRLFRLLTPLVRR
jgi:pimeloyl-ACP methyl ester carboxylesterase